MGRIGAVVLLVALLAGAVWALTRTTAAPPAPGITEQTIDPDPPPSAAPVRGDAANAAEEAAATESPMRVAAEPSEVEGPAEDGDRIAVSVVRSADGTPVPGAEVLYSVLSLDWDRMSEEERDLRAIGNNDPESLLRRFGQATRADDLGVVRIPKPEQYAQLVGLADGLFGRLTIGAAGNQEEPEDGWRLELERDVTLAVQVVDAADQPKTDVPIVLRVPFPNGLTGEQQLYPMPVGKTDEEGLLLIRHVQSRNAFSQNQTKAPTEATVAVNALAIEGLQEKVSLTDPPSEPIRFVLPPTGRLIVEVSDGRGRALSERAHVRVTVASPDEDEPVDFFGRMNAWMGPTDKDGRAVFAHVGLGRSYKITAYVHSQSLHETVVGPRGAGAEVIARLALDPDAATLVGRAIDENGKPLADTRLKFQLTGERSESQAEARTDAQGAFRVPVPAYLVGRELTTLRVARPDKDGVRMARVAVAGAIEKGARDLGNVVLREAPVLVEGRLAGDEIPMLRAAQLLVERSVGSHGREHWRRTSTFPITRDGAGFTVRGDAAGERLRLVVKSQRHLPVAPVEFAPGQLGVEIELVRGGSAKAVVLHDVPISMMQLRVQLTPRGAQPKPSRSTSTLTFLHPAFGSPMGDRTSGRASSTDDGRTTYTWNGLRAGIYDLSITTAGAETPLHEIAGVSVPASGQADDARLAEIDLRGRLRSIAIEIVDEQGERIAGKPGSVTIRSAGGATDPRGRMPLMGGRTRILTGAPSVSLTISVPGYRAVELDNVVEDQTVQLRAGYALRLRFALDALAVTEDATLSAHLSRIAYDDTGASPGGIFTARAACKVENGEGVLRVPQAASYNVSLYATSEDGLPSASVTTEPIRIDVRDVDGEQVFELRPKPRGEANKDDKKSKK